MFRIAVVEVRHLTTILIDVLPDKPEYSSTVPPSILVGSHQPSRSAPGLYRRARHQLHCTVSYPHVFCVQVHRNHLQTRLIMTA